MFYMILRWAIAKTELSHTIHATPLLQRVSTLFSSGTCAHKEVKLARGKSSECYVENSTIVAFVEKAVSVTLKTV
jgi:hypothetical protein